MTKFLTRAFRVTLLVLATSLAAFHAQAEVRTCESLFEHFDLLSAGSQTSLLVNQKIESTAGGTEFVTLHISVSANARVKAAVDSLRRGLRLRFERAVKNGIEQTDFIPLPAQATIQIPKSALTSDEALAAYLENLEPVVRTYVYMRDHEANLETTKHFSPKAESLLNRTFDNFGTRVFLKDIDSLGSSDGNTLTIDKSFAKRARSIGTVAHEIYHTTVTRKLTAHATTTDLGRASWFRLRQPKVTKAYQDEFRADEFEARLRQISILKRSGFKPEASDVKTSAADFLSVQTEACELFLTFIDEAKIELRETPRLTTAKSVVVELEGESVAIPVTRAVIDLRAYAKSVLEKRLEILRAQRHPLIVGDSPKGRSQHD